MAVKVSREPTPDGSVLQLSPLPAFSFWQQPRGASCDPRPHRHPSLADLLSSTPAAEMTFSWKTSPTAFIPHTPFLNQTPHCSHRPCPSLRLAGHSWRGEYGDQGRVTQGPSAPHSARHDTSPCTGHLQPGRMMPPLPPPLLPPPAPPSLAPWAVLPQGWVNSHSDVAWPSPMLSFERNANQTAHCLSL